MCLSKFEGRNQDAERLKMPNCSAEVLCSRQGSSDRIMQQRMRSRISWSRFHKSTARRVSLEFELLRVLLTATPLSASACSVACNSR